MTTISSVNTDMGAEFCSVGLEPSTSRMAARRPAILSRQWFNDYQKSKKKKKKLKSRMFMSLCYTRD